MMRIPVISDVADWLRDLADWRALKRLEALDRANPIRLADPFFGEMRYDRRIGWFRGKRAWNGAQLGVVLSGEWRGPPDLAQATELATAARAFWQDEAGWRERIDAVTVRDLLPLANQWLADAGEAAVNATEFCARIIPQSFTINDDDSFELWFNDGGMFAGHEILVYGTMTGGPDAAEMHG